MKLLRATGPATVTPSPQPRIALRPKQGPYPCPDSRERCSPFIIFDQAIPPPPVP